MDSGLVTICFLHTLRILSKSKPGTLIKDEGQCADIGEDGVISNDFALVTGIGGWVGVVSDVSVYIHLLNIF